MHCTYQDVTLFQISFLTDKTSVYMLLKHSSQEMCSWHKYQYPIASFNISTNKVPVYNPESVPYHSKVSDTKLILHRLLPWDLTDRQLAHLECLLSLRGRFVAF